MPPLFGRDDDLAALGHLVAAHRLVSIVGAGGMGKTRLAQAFGHSRRAAFRDGVWVVELAALTDGDLLAPTVARLLGHAHGPKGQASASLAEAMREQDVLLILDNAEHVAAATAILAEAIDRHAPAVRLLVTSQEPLRIPAEHVYRLGPLSLPRRALLGSARDFGAVALFCARAEAADARFVLSDDNLESVVEICRSMDGLPLAIELAAARVSLLGVEGVRRRLGERLRLLAAGRHNTLSRHRTIRAALEWSYGLLAPGDRDLLDQLAVFVGGFSLESARRLVGEADEWTVIDGLGTLVEKSLATVAPGEPPRYHLLESTRAFAHDRLVAAGRLDDARRSHVRAVIDTLRASDPFESTSARLLRTAAELENVRAAAAWATGPSGDPLRAIELFGEADNLWFDAGAGEEGEALFRRVQPLVEDIAPPHVAARFWLSRASLLLLKSLQEGVAAGIKAADLYASQSDAVGLFRSLAAAAFQVGMTGARERSIELADRAEALIARGWPAWARARVAHARGFAELWGGEPSQARGHFRQALDLYRRQDGDAFYAMQAWLNVVRCEYDLGHFEDLARGCREYLAYADSPDRPKHAIATFSVHVRYYLGVAQARLGDLEAAERTLRQALPPLRRAWGIASWSPVAFLLARQGRTEDAARLLGWSDASRTPGTVLSSRGHRKAHADAEEIVHAALPAEEVGRLMAEGAHLTDDTAFALAFPTSSVGPSIPK